MSTNYLQGPGTVQDAIFTQTGPTVDVVAEVGLTGCYDMTMSVDQARALWRKLVLEGWRKVDKPRRTRQAISASING